MVDGACAHFVTRIRKAAFSAYFDLGWDVATIHRQLMKVYSRRQVQRLVKEFKKNYSWEAPRPHKSGPKKRLCPLALNALSEMLEEDPTLYLRQLKCCLFDEHHLKVSVSTICRAIHEPDLSLHPHHRPHPPPHAFPSGHDDTHLTFDPTTLLHSRSLRLLSSLEQ